MKKNIQNLVDQLDDLVRDKIREMVEDKYGASCTEDQSIAMTLLLLDELSHQFQKEL